MGALGCWFDGVSGGGDSGNEGEPIVQNRYRTTVRVPTSRSWRHTKKRFVQDKTDVRKGLRLDSNSQTWKPFHIHSYKSTKLGRITSYLLFNSFEQVCINSSTSLDMQNQTSTISRQKMVTSPGTLSPACPSLEVALEARRFGKDRVALVVSYESNAVDSSFVL